MRLVWAREGRTLLAYERRAALACDRTLLVTEAEARRFCELAPESAARIDWLENGVDAETFSPGRAPRSLSPAAGAGPDIVFTGNMDYWPNADAVVWFAREVHAGAAAAPAGAALPCRRRQSRRRGAAAGRGWPACR